MTSIPPAAQVALEHARRGDFEQAIAAARDAAAAHPRDLGIRMFAAMLHIRRNELAEALPHLRAAQAIAPDDPLPRLELVRVLLGLGELDEAAALLKSSNLPGPEPLRLRAMLLERRGQYDQASAIFEEVVRADARDFESLGNLGLCLLATGQAGRAIEALSRSLQLRPDRLAIWLKWAEAHFLAGSGEQALGEIEERANSTPGDSNLRVAAAHLQNLFGRADQSLASLEEAVRRGQSNPDALIALAETLERRNDLDRLTDIIDRLASLGARSDKVAILRARLALRRRQYQEALQLAHSAPPSADAGSRAEIIGQSLDRLGDAEGAFAAFVAMNREDARTGGDVGARAEQARAALRGQSEVLTPDWIAGWAPVEAPTTEEPAFLVGFPRSGTTLLDTFLMGHPDLAVAEEEPMVATIIEKARDLSRLANLTTETARVLRESYFAEAEQHVPDARSRLLIDKNPFAMGSMPFLHRIFSGAPIIFMERHPCDVVLSCFMTRFQPTGLGANFVTIEDTAKLYDEMMQLWSRSAELLPLRVHRVRYERLVQDAESELRPLADFLGLDWRPELLDHRATARARAYIKTPSYSQVTEPVSKAPVGRWTRYRAQLEPVLPILEPWVQKLGYDL